ncbi:hypothetical protein EZV62_027721 [Acer yangbiense]|uniref:Retrotransposon gag domain-containing protein n=1 Tax=Acer yangbiense TaxID=1000413 RepID=A0A5C7GVD3_9ROSI|nr:hypothetical protein EZV62_027721 [Acer yangbiense]
MTKNNESGKTVTSEVLPLDEGMSSQNEEVVSTPSKGEMHNIRAAYRLNGKNYLKWSQVVQTFLKGKGKVKDAAQVYGIRTKIASTKQGNSSVTEYANALQNLWQEMDHYRCIAIKCSDDAATLKKIME